MKKKEIQKYYSRKTQLINEYNKFYYDKSRPKVSDDEYDKLKKEILLLEKKYEFLDSRNSPLENVGYKPSKNFKKVPHRVPMLSLTNAFKKEDLLNFEKRVLNFISQTEQNIDSLNSETCYETDFKIFQSNIFRIQYLKMH